MSFIKKIKDILFEEEEYTEPIKIKDEKKEEPIREKKEVFVSSPVRDDSIKDTIKEDSVKDINRDINRDMPFSRQDGLVRENFKEESVNTFKFPDFDEEEFASSMASKMTRTRPNTNVLDYERKKQVEKRNDYNRYDTNSNRDRDNKEIIEKKKFKPSPIISPVYGILDRDYRAEDITNREDKALNIDIEEVRKKAFEPKKVVEEEKIVVEKTKEEVIDEPVVTFFEEKETKQDTSDKKYKSIDDLLESASEEIPLEDTLELPKTNNLDAIEEELEKIDEEQPPKLDINNGEKEETLDDPLDSDLFELIDSMYDDRGEG